jgi:mannose-6-phosphate isomerase-like protein (cupin superfamily)
MAVGALPGLGSILADDALTNGAYEFFEAHTPKGAGPPLHVHEAREEAFYVVTGNFRFVLGDQVRDTGPGDFVMVPRGTPHRFVSLGDDARVVFVVSPPGLERFFREGTEMRESGRPDPEVRIELAQRYDSRPVFGA